MKYLTREWYVKARLSYIDGSVRCSKLAEKFDESFYNAVYQKKYEKFERNERLQDEFRDIDNDLKRRYIQEKVLLLFAEGSERAWRKESLLCEYSGKIERVGVAASQGDF